MEGLAKRKRQDSKATARAETKTNRIAPKTNYFITTSLRQPRWAVQSHLLVHFELTLHVQCSTDATFAFAQTCTHTHTSTPEGEI